MVCPICIINVDRLSVNMAEGSKKSPVTGPGPQFPSTSPASIPSPLLQRPRRGETDFTTGLTPAVLPPPEGPKKWYQHIYDRDKRLFCDRTCGSWLAIVAYSIMYIIFLTTFTLLVLYGSLLIVKSQDFIHNNSTKMMYFKSGIGLTVTPTSEYSSPMIWYRKGEAKDYRKYVNALEKLVSERTKKDGIGNLGPCSKAPFEYGDSPCVIVRINKQWGWAAKPLQPGSPNLAGTPSEVQRWVQKDAKLWLHCTGYYPYDLEHLGNVKYYPDPPGFDPGVFPLAKGSESPLIAVQLSNFTLGVSIVVECRLWYQDGVSRVNFVLYVGSSRKNKSL